MANYVKFRRGTSADFINLGSAVDKDTLYFIYEEDGSSADLYLGSKKISGAGGSSISNLADIKDVIISEVQDRDLLVFDNDSQSWVNRTVDEILSDYIATIQPVILSINNNNNNSHSDLINQESVGHEFKSGDIIIIKDIIADDKYQHCGYVYDGIMWRAMDGNYNAENIYFDEDFIITEDIGVIEVPKDKVTVSAAGKNLKEFLSSIFAKEKDPEVVQPSAIISLMGAADSYEVGTVYTPEYEVDFIEGSYSFNDFTNVKANAYEITDSNGNSSTLEKDSFYAFTIKDDTNYSINATVSYSEGIVPVTNLGNSCPDKQIVEGSTTAFSKTITGYRNCFFGCFSTKEDLTSDSIRSLNHSKFSELGKYVINIPEGIWRVVFACPKNSKTPSIKDINAMSAEINNAFEKDTLTVGGANNLEGIDYDVYILDYGKETSAINRYDVIFE